MECIIKETVLIIPEGTKKIGFTDICDYIHNNLIEEILLPSTLETIDANTFFDFTELKKINIPKSVIEIGAQAFWGLDQMRAWRSSSFRLVFYIITHNSQIFNSLLKRIVEYPPQ